MKRPLVLLTALLAVASGWASEMHPSVGPYEPKHGEYQTTLLIVGGSSSGTAAAVTAGRLRIPTIWVLRAPRDMGGLSTNAINPDSDLPMRYLGGLALEYDVNARFTTGFHVGGRHNGEGYFAPYLLVDAGEKDVDASVDIFLEQTRNEAAAGIVVRAGDARNMQRFLLQAKGPAVEARIDAVVDGQRTEEERWLIPTIKRGFTLRVVAVGDNFSYWIDGAEVKRLRRSQHARGTEVGVVNGGGESSRFDNLEVKHCW